MSFSIESHRRLTVGTALVLLVGTIAAVSQPVSGIFYQSPVVFLSVYLLRESWIAIALLGVLFLVQNAMHCGKLRFSALLPLFIFFTAAFFILFIAVTDNTPGPMVVFLQFRNIFGFSLAVIFALYVSRTADPVLLSRLLVALAAFSIAYCYLELYVYASEQYLISDQWFNKQLLEEAKGTRADVFGGVFTDRRIPGPLFNPSQMGIYAVYLIIALGQLSGRSVALLKLGLFGVVLLGVSKSAFAMLVFALILRIGGRSIGLIGVIAFAFLPFALDLLSAVFPTYHVSSVTRHFEGYMGAVQALAETPFGTGTASAGELASTLGGFEAEIGYESGMGTILSNLGVLGIALYFVVMLYCYKLRQPEYFTFFSLWSVSMFFNEGALSPHLFVFQLVAAVVIAQQHSVPRTKSPTGPEGVRTGEGQLV